MAQESNWVKKTSTGIKGFDYIAMGGLPQGRSTLLAGTSGSCKTILGVQYLVMGIEKFKEGAVFVTFEETPQDMRQNMLSFGWDLAAYEKGEMWAFVDVSPDPNESVEVVGTFDLSALLARIEHAVNKVKGEHKRVVIDSVSALFSQFADANLVRHELFRIASGLKLMGVTSLITAERTEEYGEIARFHVEEFVADNVIVLRHILDEEKRRRTVEILKFRGASHQNGEYPFTISSHGVEVLPLSATPLGMESSVVRIGSGNKDLDRMCGGGFYRDSIVLVSGATGTGKTLITTTFLNDGCKKKEKCLVFAFEESRSQLTRNATAWGIDFTNAEDSGLLKIVCTYPEISSLADHLLRMQEIIEVFKPERIAVDSLSALERVSTGKAFREFVVGLTSFIKDKQVIGLFTATATTLLGGTSVTEHHISTITDSIILLRYVELPGEMRRGMTVLKMRGSWHEKVFREYTIDSQGIHIGDPFRNVTGILAGTPQQYLADEQLKMGEMFDDVS
jgi:circadian clock protein KaiC